MAGEVEIAKTALDVLSKSSELMSKFSAVSKVLQIVSSFSSAFPLVGAVLGMVKSFLPDTKHEEILRCFEKLNAKIDQVRDDIKDLEKMIKWENVKLQYADVVNRIELGMQFCLEMGKAKDKDSKMRFQERLEEVCANQEFTLAVNSLLDGMIGSGLFQNSILDDFYEKTNGDRPKISSLASRLLQLVSGGLIVIATYEATVRGKQGATEMMKMYEKRLSEVSDKIQSVLGSCVNNFRDHMLSDLNHILDKNGLSNEALLGELRTLMKDKYDWQEHYCLVYDNLQGFEKHCFNGDRVESLHRNGKCGIVFYRNADVPALFSDRYDEAYKIVEKAFYYDAEEGYKTIIAKLEERGIPWTGCAVVSDSANVRFGGNFSTRVVELVGSFSETLMPHGNGPPYPIIRLIFSGHAILMLQ